MEVYEKSACALLELINWMGKDVVSLTHERKTTYRFSTDRYTERRADVTEIGDGIYLIHLESLEGVNFLVDMIKGEVREII